jgi:drug/metabolite transporter (DMT)-like permease
MDSKAKVLKYDAIFLIAAVIWGFAFVAQRAGMKHVGPFTFIAVRLLLGSIFLVPLLFITGGAKIDSQDPGPQPNHKFFLLGCGLAGLILFLAQSFQQFGIVYTTAGKAWFHHGLYAIIVPFFGLLWGQKTTSAPGQGLYWLLSDFISSVLPAVLSRSGRFCSSFSVHSSGLHIFLYR